MTLHDHDGRQPKNLQYDMIYVMVFDMIWYML